MTYQTKTQKRNERRKKKKALSFVKMQMLQLFVIIFKELRGLIDLFINFIFGLYYGNQKIEKIPKVEKPFLKESSVRIAKYIRHRKLTAEEVVEACIERIRGVNGILNAVTDDRFDQAIEEAREIDRKIQEGSYSEEYFQKKPFLGVPFTTKDSTACEGMLWTFGLTCRKDVRATEDADVVAQMKSAGGILLAKTNIPEFNLWQETRNSLFGQTVNPYNTTRTTGGSSGGEASLIAACGSPMGIGTDIGGSIRMPAFFCGVYGHKPSSYLISTKGLTRRTGTEKHTMVVAGPMTRHAEDLIPMLKVFVGSNINKLKLDIPVDVTKLKYFYCEESRDVRVSPVLSEMKEAMSKVVNHFNDLLSPEGVELLDIDEFKYSSRLWRYWMTQENTNFASELANRKGVVNAWSELFYKLFGFSNYTLAAIFKLIDDKLPKEKEAWALETTTILKEKLLSLLGDNGVLFFPSYTWPASFHYTAFLRPYNFSYWSIFNVLQVPVTQIPLGLTADGLPVGIQVVAAPYNDHLCLAVAKHLEETFGGYVPPF